MTARVQAQWLGEIRRNRLREQCGLRQFETASLPGGTTSRRGTAQSGKSSSDLLHAGVQKRTRRSWLQGVVTAAPIAQIARTKGRLATAKKRKFESETA